MLALTATGVLSVMGDALGSLQDSALSAVGNTLVGVAVVVSLVGMVAAVIPGQPARTVAQPLPSAEVRARATDDPA